MENTNNTKSFNLSAKKQQVMEWCRQLACSQGFYGRLYNDLCENDDYLTAIAEQNPKNAVDFVMLMEC